MNVFMDTSAIVKIYVDEAYSDIIRGIYSSSDNTIYIADIAKVEFCSAIKKRLNQTDIEEEQYSSIKTYFLNDYRDGFEVIKSKERLLDQALELIHGYSLKAYDSVQLAAALQCQNLLRNHKLIFVSFDKKLINAARKNDLEIFNIPEKEQISQERALKSIIFDHIARYYKEFHRPIFEKEFIPGKSRINYAGRVYDEKEMINLVDASLDFWLTAGRYDREFCEKLSAYLNTSDMPDVKSITVNSGSSANLLAIGSLTSPKLGDLKLCEGDEVITVAAGFPTSIAPVVQNSLIPVFVDVELGSYNIDSGKIEEAISEKTKAVFLAHTLGMPFDLDKILELAEKYRLWLIEDNCDALGAEYTLKREYNLIRNKKISGRGKTGTFGHIGTSSFYPAHQITMGEGGAVYTSDIDLYRIAKSFRDWGRDCWCEPGCDNTCKKRFKQQLGKLPPGYDHKYTYSHIGYNLKITDMQAAIGAAQMDKVSAFAEKRLENWKRLEKGVNDLEDVFILPAYPKNSIPSPFGFALTVRDNAKFTREDITSFLEKNNIQTRTVFAGNMLRQPAFADAEIKLRIGNSSLLVSKNLTDKQYSRLPKTEITMSRTFWIGVYPGMNEEMIDYMIQKIQEFIERK